MTLPQLSEVAVGGGRWGGGGVQQGHGKKNLKNEKVTKNAIAYQILYFFTRWRYSHGAAQSRMNT